MQETLKELVLSPDRETMDGVLKGGISSSI